LRHFLFILILVLPKGGFSSSKEETASLFSRLFPTSSCQERVKALDQFKLLFALPEFASFIKEEKGSVEKLMLKLSGWSSDLLLQLIFQIEQEIEKACPKDKRLESLAQRIKRQSLDRLGINPEKLSSSEVNSLFAGTLALQADREKIQKRIAELKKIGFTPKNLLSLLYGSSKVVRGVVVVAPQSFSFKSLEAAIQEACGSLEPCPYWNRPSLYKVIISPESGIAGYVPEMATLLLSEDLLTTRNVLHKIVTFHELVHVWERTVWLEKREEPAKEFANFSGWVFLEGKWTSPLLKSEKVRLDELTHLSETSSYSLLPDPVYLGTNDKVDGLVLGKTYEEVTARGEISEDLADHAAVLKYYPSRFCLADKNIAPRKEAWLIQRLFPKTAPVKCSK
jgi:hypothetical protein